MNLATNRLTRVLRQFERRTLWMAAIAAGLAIALGAVFGPTSRGGAILLAVGGSVLASLIIAAVALERTVVSDRFTRAGITQLFVDRYADIPEEVWPKLLAGAVRHFRVLGTSNHGYLNNETAKRETAAALRTALSRKRVTVEFLWLDPFNPLSEVREGEEGERALIRDSCEAITFFSDLVADLPDDQRNRVSLREYTSLPTCGITWADHQLVVTHYLAGRLNLHAPGLILDAGRPLIGQALGKIGVDALGMPPLTAAYIKNYTEVASNSWSRAITADRVEACRRRYAELADQIGKRSEALLRHEPEAGGDTDG